MPIWIEGRENYRKALVLLIRRGGMFQTRDPNGLIIGPGQFQALHGAGLVRSKEKPDRKRKKGTHST